MGQIIATFVEETPHRDFPIAKQVKIDPVKYITKKSGFKTKKARIENKDCV